METTEQAKAAAKAAAHETQEAIDAAKHKAEQLAREAKHTASEVKDKAEHKAAELLQEAKHTAEEIKHKAGDKIDEAKKDGGFFDKVKDKAEVLLKRDLDGDGKIG